MINFLKYFQWINLFFENFGESSSNFGGKKEKKHPF